MGVHQALDTVGRNVERRREFGDLVLALDRNASLKIAFAELRDARLQLFQAARQPAYQRIESDR